MTRFLLILLLLAVVAVIVWLAVRTRASSRDELPADDLPGAIGPGQPDDADIGPLPADISESMESVFEHPEPVEPPSEYAAPEEVAETVPPMEPEPIIEPEPPVEPEPIIEPEPEPVEPEPIAATHGDPLATEAAELSSDPPQAVIDAGEKPAVDLDPHAGWETDDDTTIHADPESGLYHTPDSPGYKLGSDGQVFESEDDAREAGFTRWDEPR